ncbi:MAG: DnaJ C-terminal domain-containing protein [Promethearchaeota archaeon]
MFSEEISHEARRWMIFFFLKANIFIFGLFFLLNGFMYQSTLTLIVAFPLLVIGMILVYHDVQSDPYQILRLFKIQVILWWRLQGPFIKRKPYFYHFPEGNQLQEKDLTRTVSVTQKELIEGVNKRITVKTAQLCPECDGKRSKPMTVQIECSQCKDGRQIQPLGAIYVPTPCKYCLGVGWIPVHPCSICRGKGSVWRNQKIRVQIPPQASTGTKLRIPALGRIDPKTLQQGDLFLKLRKKLFNLI